MVGTTSWESIAESRKNLQEADSVGWKKAVLAEYAAERADDNKKWEEEMKFNTQDWKIGYTIYFRSKVC